MEEALVLMTEELISRIRKLFDSCKEEDSQVEVDFNQLIATLFED